MPRIKDPIEPSDLIKDKFPTHRAKFGQGGLRTVKDIEERDSIPFERCEEGMIVFIESLKEYWCLIKNTRDTSTRVWERFKGNTKPSIIKDDNSIDNEKVWSSSKIKTEIENIIEDDIESKNKTWSSKKIAEEIVLNGTGIDDEHILATKVWSSRKTVEEISNVVDDTIDSDKKTWSSNKIKAIIDDTKGKGETRNTWSADKLSRIINDDKKSSHNTWSAEKISNIVDDNAVNNSNTWSSKKISCIVDDNRTSNNNTWSAEKISKIVDDNTIDENKTWSSAKILGEIEKAESIDNFGLPTKLEQLDNVIKVDYLNLDYTFATENLEKLYKHNPSFGVAVYKDGFIASNLDGFFNKKINTIIKTNRSFSYAGSVSTCSNYTFEGKPETKILPFVVNNGINTYGVSAVALSVPSLGNTEAKPSNGLDNVIDSVCLVRFVLDNFSSAREACNYLQKHTVIKIHKSLKDSGYELHWMIADRDECFWLEIVDNKVVFGEFKKGQEKILSNFHYSSVNWDYDKLPSRNYKVYTPTDSLNGLANKDLGVDLYGHGLERYNNLIELFNSSSNEITETDILDVLKKIYFTNLYKDNSNLEKFYSDLTSMNDSYGLTVDSSFKDFETKLKTFCDLYNRYTGDKERSNDGMLLQTKHSVVYNTNNKSLKARFNEGDSITDDFVPYADLADLLDDSIDDNITSNENTWSSEKIVDSISKVMSDAEVSDNKTWSSHRITKLIDDRKGKDDKSHTWSADKLSRIIDDENTSKKNTWSSEKISGIIDDETTSKKNTWSSEKISGIIDDSKTTEKNTWSSDKILKQIDDNKVEYDKTWSSMKIGSIVDDTKGPGDTGNTWSADKISRIIDDTSFTTTNTWSSHKISNIVNDDTISDTNTWSSNKIKSIIDDTKGLGDKDNTWSADRISRLIDDEAETSLNTWSAHKISNVIQGLVNEIQELKAKIEILENNNSEVTGEI